MPQSTASRLSTNADFPLVYNVLGLDVFFLNYALLLIATSNLSLFVIIVSIILIEPYLFILPPSPPCQTTNINRNFWRDSNPFFRTPGRTVTLAVLDRGVTFQPPTFDGGAEVTLYPLIDQNFCACILTSCC